MTNYNRLMVEDCRISEICELPAMYFYEPSSTAEPCTSEAGLRRLKRIIANLNALPVEQGTIWYRIQQLKAPTLPSSSPKSQHRIAVFYYAYILSP